MVTADRLLEGEDPQTSFGQDARHWIGVYRQMIDFKRELLDRVRSQIGRLPAPARADVAYDVELIQDQLTRYERRLEFWYARQWQLEGLRIDRDSRTISHRDHSVGLTRRELQLFETLAQRSPSFITAERLLAEAWNDSDLPSEALRTYIVRLRTKLGQLEIGAEIVNRPRRGYALVFQATPARV